MPLDMVEKLERGARVADVGCGHGYSTLLMATAFPNSEFVGFDFHADSIEKARRHARSRRRIAATRLRDCRLVVVPGAGHIAPFTHAAQVVPDIERHLLSHVPAGTETSGAGRRAEEILVDANPAAGA